MNKRSSELARELKPNERILSGNTAAVVQQINEMGDTGQLERYEVRRNAKGQRYFLVETKPLGAKVMQYGQPTRRVHPAIVWTGVGVGVGLAAVVAYVLVVLVEAVAANIVLLAALAAVVVAVGGLVGRQCVITITHRH